MVVARIDLLGWSPDLQGDATGCSLVQAAASRNHGINGRCRVRHIGPPSRLGLSRRGRRAVHSQPGEHLQVDWNSSAHPERERQPVRQPRASRRAALHVRNRDIRTIAAYADLRMALSTRVLPSDQIAPGTLWLAAITWSNAVSIQLPSSSVMVSGGNNLIVCRP